jgi:hypothetical protein
MSTEQTPGETPTDPALDVVPSPPAPPFPGQFEQAEQARADREAADTAIAAKQAEEQAQARRDAAVVVAEPDLGDALAAAKGVLAICKRQVQTRGHVPAGVLVDAIAKAEQACGQTLA